MGGGEHRCVQALKALPSDSVDCVVMSPPYYWQRDYGVKGQSGQDESINEYVANLTRVFRQVRRALKKRVSRFLSWATRTTPGGGDLMAGIRSRSGAAWRKPKGFAEPSVRDRPWNASETVFILARKSTYWF